MNIRRFKQTLKQVAALSLLALLAACGSTVPPAVSPGGTNYLLTVNLEQSDTREGVAQRYGGEVIAWLDDKAILKMNEEAVAQLQARGISMQNTTLEDDAAIAAPVSAQGWNAWGGGWNAWGSGWNAWGSGWNAWSGGSALPTLPSDNRPFFMVSHLIEAHTMSRNFGSGIKVAVIDTGLDLAHPMFSGRLAPSTEWRDFVDNDSNPQEVSGSAYGHGTAAAGLIVQYAPRATILPIRVLGSDGKGDVSRIVSAISWAISQNVRVINLSLGTNVDVAALRTILESATSRGIYVVASAGNEGNATTLTWPAQYAKTIAGSQYLISVGSAFGGDTLSTFSNRGTALETVLMGEWLMSAYPDSRVARVRGTSFAAPQVAGTLALMIGETSPANAANLQSYIFESGWTLNGAEFIHVMSLLRSLPDFTSSKNALYVVGNTTLNIADKAVEDILWRMGYNITYRSGSAATTADATGKHLIVISSSVSAVDVNSKFRNVAVPVVTWEAALYDDLGMVSAASNASFVGNQNSLSILPISHPLSAGFNGSSAFTAQVFLSIGSMATAIPLSSAIRIANLANDPSRAAVFAYNQGAQLQGLTAPARRVALHFHDASGVNARDHWISEFLFISAVNWAVTGN